MAPTYQARSASEPSGLPSRWRLTYDDYRQFPDDGKRHEILGGEHYVTPAPRLSHQRVVGCLHLLIGGFAQQEKHGEVFTAPVDVVLGPSDIVQPDLVWVSPERSNILSEANIQGAPDLVIEVSSPSTRKLDETTKRKLYERHGVREYWIVDPELERLRVYLSGSDGLFEEPRELSVEQKDRATPSVLPGLNFEVAEIFV